MHSSFLAWGSKTMTTTSFRAEWLHSSFLAWGSKTMMTTSFREERMHWSFLAWGSKTMATTSFREEWMHLSFLAWVLRELNFSAYSYECIHSSLKLVVVVFELIAQLRPKMMNAFTLLWNLSSSSLSCFALFSNDKWRNISILNSQNLAYTYVPFFNDRKTWRI